MPIVLSHFRSPPPNTVDMDIRPDTLPRWDRTGTSWISATGAYQSDWRGIPDDHLNIAPPAYYLLTGQQPAVDRTILAAARGQNVGTMSRIRAGTPLQNTGA